jgi:hypothetical protein
MRFTKKILLVALVALIYSCSENNLEKPKVDNSISSFPYKKIYFNGQYFDAKDVTENQFKDAKTSFIDLAIPDTYFLFTSEESLTSYLDNTYPAYSRMKESGSNENSRVQLYEWSDFVIQWDSYFCGDEQPGGYLASTGPNIPQYGELPDFISDPGFLPGSIKFRTPPNGEIYARVYAGYYYSSWVRLGANNVYYTPLFVRVPSNSVICVNNALFSHSPFSVTSGKSMTFSLARI